MTDPLYAPLEHLYHTYDYRGRIAADPIELVHEAATDADREIVGLLASGLAYGRASIFKPKIRQLLAHMAESGGPRAYVERFDLEAERAWLTGFRHRVTSGLHVGRLLYALRILIEHHGSLEAAFASGFSPAHEDVGPALTAFVESIYRLGPPPDRAFRHLLPSPGMKSACKRLNLYLRWMVRVQPGVDLGIWRSIPTSHLVLPLDTHTLRLGYNLGLTSRQDQSWRTAVEITRRLRMLDPADPVKYDFALCHLGMAGGCPSRREEAICARCDLKGICRWWGSR